MSTIFSIYVKDPLHGRSTPISIAHRYSIGDRKITVKFYDIARYLRSDVMLTGEDGSVITLSTLRKQNKEGRMRERRAGRSDRRSWGGRRIKHFEGRRQGDDQDFWNGNSSGRRSNFERRKLNSRRKR